MLTHCLCLHFLVPQATEGPSPARSTTMLAPAGATEHHSPSSAPVPRAGGRREGRRSSVAATIASSRSYVQSQEAGQAATAGTAAGGGSLGLDGAVAGSARHRHRSEAPHLHPSSSMALGMRSGATGSASLSNVGLGVSVDGVAATPAGQSTGDEPAAVAIGGEGGSGTKSTAVSPRLGGTIRPVLSAIPDATERARSAKLQLAADGAAAVGGAAGVGVGATATAGGGGGAGAGAGISSPSVSPVSRLPPLATNVEERRASVSAALDPER